MSLVLAACGEARRPPPAYSETGGPIASGPTVTPPYQSATNLSPNPGATATVQNQLEGLLVPTSSPLPPSPALPTPLLIPTPGVPTEAILTADDLGITGWTDTEISWSPAGDQFMLHALRGEDQSDFYFLVRPPASPVASFKLSRTTFGALAWSPDGRYLSYIDQSNDGTPGPVKVIDTVGAPSQARELFKGPCTTAAWLSPTKLVAACGLTVYSFSVISPAEGEVPAETLYKLDGGRFSGSTMELGLIARALPSPDGKWLTMYGLAKQKSSLPLGEIAFLNLASNKFSILERDNRPVVLVDWTPDSKYLILRNLTGDWAVPYTFDFYLADPTRPRITQNLTQTNPKCDPVLGGKADCQGLQPSPYQAARLSFGPDGNRYLFTGVRYVAQPNVALEAIERLTLGTLSGRKLEKPVELTAGDKIVGVTWLPNGHYFYSRSPLRGPALPVLDGQPANLKSSALAALVKSGTPQAQAKTKTVAPKPGTKAAAASDIFRLNLLDQAEGTPSPFLTPSPSANVIIQLPATSLPQLTATSGPPGPAGTPATGQTAPVATSTPNPPTTVVVLSPSPTRPIFFPTAATSLTPAGTQILQIYTATPDTRKTSTPRSINSPKAAVSVTATADTSQLRPIAFYASPTANWILSLERIAGNDKSVQFQVRLIPFSVK